MNILYVHGYNGSSEGGSYRLLKKHLPKGYQILGIDYDQDDCEKALQQIKEVILEKKIEVVIGCSLGGFLTLLTEGITRYVINPCYHPSIELPKLGPNIGQLAPAPSMIATYEKLEHKLKKISTEDKKNIHCYISNNDELFGDKYVEEIITDLGKTPKILFSTHHLSESAAETICCLIGLRSSSNKNIEAALKDAHKYSACHDFLIQRSQNCGCFSCKKIFPASSILDYLKENNNRTAFCPNCFTDAVLPDSCPYAPTSEFLKKMNKRWF